MKTLTNTRSGSRSSTTHIGSATRSVMALLALSSFAADKDLNSW
jgi:hypothetical protein